MQTPGQRGVFQAGEWHAGIWVIKYTLTFLGLSNRTCYLGSVDIYYTLNIATDLK